MQGQKRYPLITTLNIAFFFLSITLFDSGSISLKIMGASPFVTLCVLVVFSCFAKPAVAAAVGFIVGAFTDSISTHSYCFNTILLFVLAVAASLLASNVFNRNLKATVALCFLISAVYHIAYWCFFIAFSVNLSQSTEYFLGFALPSVVYNAAISIPFYFIYKKFEKIKAEN